MARGRMLVKEFCYDERIWKLKNNDILIFVSIIPHTESDGTIVANPNILKGLCLPLSEITTQEIGDAIKTFKSTIPPLVEEIETKHEKRIKLTDFEWANENLDFMRKRQSRLSETVLDSPRQSQTVTQKEGTNERSKERIKNKNIAQSHTKGDGTAQIDSNQELRPGKDQGQKQEKAFLLIFPTAGPLKEWGLTQEKVVEWAISYPGVDILAECRKARQWVIDNPVRKKTANGMTRFLSSWLARAQNQSRGLVPMGEKSDIEKFREKSQELRRTKPWLYDVSKWSDGGKNDASK